jgi:hypothetical protein
MALQTRRRTTRHNRHAPYVSEAEQKYLAKRDRYVAVLLASSRPDDVHRNSRAGINPSRADPERHDLAGPPSPICRFTQKQRHPLLRVQHAVQTYVQRFVHLQTAGSLSIRPPRISRRRRVDQRPSILRSQDDFMRGGISRRSELAGGFRAAQIGVQHRNTLEGLGYPQSATSLRMDNTVALGIAEGKTNGDRSKSMNMSEVLLAGGQGPTGAIQHLSCSRPVEHSGLLHQATTTPQINQFAPYLAINMDEQDDNMQS